MADLEQRITVTVGADTVFELLSDPMQLPGYVPTIELVDSIALDGELDLDADVDERDGAPEAGYIADRATRRIEWGRPASGYAGSIAIGELSSRITTVTVRLQTRDDADRAAVQKVFDESVARIRTLLTGR